MRLSRLYLVRRFSNSKFIWLYLSICFVLYVEIFSYHFNKINWYNPKCANENDCTKILLVADPQIIGVKNEVVHFLTPVNIYDSDRYLKKTYSHAYNFVKPNIVIFLGDLMDEAQTATDEEFYSYVRRLFNIFLDHKSSSENVRHIWLPGDNDIGGEDTSVTPEKLQRFERAFSQPDIIPFKNITFFKLNRLTSKIPVYKGEREFYNTNHLFVGLSHVPLMFKPSQFVDKILTKMLPQLLFTAHEHKSMIISTDASLRQDFHIVPITPGNNKVFTYTLGRTDMYEIMVPTCSYRMGTTKIGFGFAIIEKNELQFTVLWSPSRFHQLGSYLVLIFLLLLCGILKYCFCK